MKIQSSLFVKLCFVAVLLALMQVWGCGYKLASEEPSVLGTGDNTLKIKRVESSALYPWLSHLIRTAVYDEVNYRNLGRWVESGEANYEIDIEITSFYISDHGYSRESTAVMYSASMTMILRVYDGSTNEQLWSSESLSLSRVYDTDNAQTATEELSRELTRRCMDRMRFVF